MSRNIKPIGVRIPEELRAQLREQAANNHRSLNAEIITRLEQSQQQPTPPTEALDRVCARLGIPAAAMVAALAEILQEGINRPESHEASLIEPLIATAREARNHG